MFGFLGFRNKCPPKVATDVVVPLHWFEDGWIWKSIVAYSFFVVDDQLDVIKMKAALEGLVERKGYRKLGGRLRQGDHGGLEYHIPAEFSPDRPAIAFTHDNHDIEHTQHPIACKIPRPKGLTGPTIVGDPEELSDLVRPGGGTLSIKDYLTTDRPMLGLHITTFRDITCLTLHWPHCSFDALGKKSILEGWNNMLNGRTDSIPEPIGFDNDPLVDFGKHATEKHVLADRRLGVAGLAWWAVRNIRGLASAQEMRTVCIPASFWERMVAECRAQLRKEAESMGEEPPFVSEGDVITAWWMKVCCCHMSKDSTTTITLVLALSLRRSLKHDLLPANRPFISLALGYPSTNVPACDVISKPLSWLALQIRRAIQTQGTRSQVEALAAMQRQSNTNMPIMFGDTGMYSMFVSNWQQAGVFEFDWSRAAKNDRQGEALKPRCVLCLLDPAFPEGSPISGRDGDGNYWISGYRRKGLWSKMEEELKRQSEELKLK